MLGSASQAAAQAHGCPNCGAEIVGRYCPACGQDHHHDVRRPVRRFLAELVEETLSLDGRLLRTLPALLFVPGKVAAEVTAGRRVRYTSALKLYLGASLALFLAVAGGKDVFHFRVVSPQDVLSREQHASGVAEAAAALRSKGGAGSFLADRLQRLAALPPAEADRRVTAAFEDNAPRVLFLLVPMLALLLKLAFPRRFYAEHLVVALHAQAVGFLAMVPSALTGWDSLQDLAVVASAVWGLVALRRVYGQGWAATALKFVGVGLAYALLLGVGIAAAALLSIASL